MTKCYYTWIQRPPHWCLHQFSITCWTLKQAKKRHQQDEDGANRAGGRQLTPLVWTRVYIFRQPTWAAGGSNGQTLLIQKGTT